MGLLQVLWGDFGRVRGMVMIFQLEHALFLRISEMCCSPQTNAPIFSAPQGSSPCRMQAQVVPLPVNRDEALPLLKFDSGSSYPRYKCGCFDPRHSPF